MYKDEPGRSELFAGIRIYLHGKYYYKKVNSQIEQYHQELGLDNFQILSVLSYWYDVKHNDPEKSGGGIGIVPHIYKEALEYWENKKRQKEILDALPSYELPQEESLKAPAPVASKPKTVKLFELK